MDTDAPGSAGPAPKNRTALARRRRRTVLTGLLGVPAVTVLAARPSPYTATTSVQVHPTGTAEAGGLPADELDLKTQAQLAASEHTTGLMSETLAEQTGVASSPAATPVAVEEPVTGTASSAATGAGR